MKTFKSLAIFALFTTLPCLSFATSLDTTFSQPEITRIDIAPSEQSLNELPTGSLVKVGDDYYHAASPEAITSYTQIINDYHGNIKGITPAIIRQGKTGREVFKDTNAMQEKKIIFPTLQDLHRFDHDSNTNPALRDYVESTGRGNYKFVMTPHHPVDSKKIYRFDRLHMPEPSQVSRK